MFARHSVFTNDFRFNHFKEPIESRSAASVSLLSAYSEKELKTTVMAAIDDCRILIRVEVHSNRNRGRLFTLKNGRLLLASKFIIFIGK